MAGFVCFFIQQPVDRYAHTCAKCIPTEKSNLVNKKSHPVTFDLLVKEKVLLSIGHNLAFVEYKFTV